MKIWLITGGARSGKSGYALDRARALGGGEVTFVATGSPGDDEMAERIQRHRRERPESWETLEAPRRPNEALARARHSTVIVDCLTLLVANALDGAASEAQALERSREAVTRTLEAAREREGNLLVVTNEVGMGLVPTAPLGRWFRDAQGAANREVAAVATGVIFLVSGVPWLLAGSKPGD